MKTLCFKVEDTLFQDFKVRVASSGKTTQQYMDELLRDALQSPEDKIKSIAQIRTELKEVQSQIKALDKALSAQEKAIAAEQE